MKDGEKGDCCPVGMCKTMGPHQKLGVIYGVLVVVLAALSGAGGLWFWLLILLGAGMVFDAFTGKCPLACMVRKSCGSKGDCGDKKGDCDTKGSCDTKVDE